MPWRTCSPRAWLLDAAAVLEYLEEREKLGSTGFGRGVAIPHARLPGIARPVAAVLRLEHPVDYSAADGLPVELVFGLLSPENSGATHLHALAAVFRGWCARTSCAIPCSTPRTRRLSTRC